jgi:hypothetical protein
MRDILYEDVMLDVRLTARKHMLGMLSHMFDNINPMLGHHEKNWLNIRALVFTTCTFHKVSSLL